VHSAEEVERCICVQTGRFFFLQEKLWVSEASDALDLSDFLAAFQRLEQELPNEVLLGAILSQPMATDQDNAAKRATRCSGDLQQTDLLLIGICHN
jgi:hypothetical protein